MSTNAFSGSLITCPDRIFSLATRTGCVSGVACLAEIRAVRYAATSPHPMARNIITNVFDFIAAHLRVVEWNPRAVAVPHPSRDGLADADPAAFPRVPRWRDRPPSGVLVRGPAAPRGTHGVGRRVVPEGQTPPRREIAFR